MKNLMKDIIILILLSGFLSLHFDFRLILVIISILYFVSKFQKLNKTEKEPTFTNEINSWLNELDDAVKRGDISEITRCYNIIMNIIHSESLLETKEHMYLKRKISNIISPLKKLSKNDFITPRNAFKEPNYEVSTL